ncbi:hypothetical protein RP20_CCG011294 [Aedes albopictus]|nr:hypothetical protein RP20_CCG011294 [Aedes albopictus]
MEQTVEKRFFPRSIFQSCSQEPSKISGTYLLQPDGNEQAFEGFCEQVKYGGGWLVIQHRFDGSVDFYRDWAEYKDGFGKVDGEHWIGLERLHQLTKNKNMTLMVEFVDIDGNYNYASYNSFAVGNEDEKYELKRLGEFVGSTGDSMRSGEKQRFTTRDSDNDKFGRNCAQDEGGAWWYAHCGGTPSEFIIVVAYSASNFTGKGRTFLYPTATNGQKAAADTDADIMEVSDGGDDVGRTILRWWCASGFASAICTLMMATLTEFQSILAGLRRRNVALDGVIGIDGGTDDCRTATTDCRAKTAGCRRNIDCW